MPGEQKPADVRDALEQLTIDRSSTAPDAVTTMSTRRRAAAIVGVLLLIVASGWGGAVLFAGHLPEVRVVYASRTGDELAAPVLQGAGYIVTGDRYISLGARVPGRVAAYFVEEGESVEAGQPLVRLDDRHYKAVLREAKASYRVAVANAELRRKEHARMRELRGRGVLSEADFDVKENQVQVADAEVDRVAARVAQLWIDVEDTVVRAPTSGVVLEKFKEVGEMATPGGFAGSGELIRMANVDELRAEVEVNESDLSRVAMAQPAEVVPDAFPERRYAASVVKLYPQINRQRGTLRVEVKIEAPDEWLRPDMSVRIHFLDAPRAAARERVVVAPHGAIRSDGRGDYVWVVAAGQLERRQVVTATAAGEGERVVVARGLSGGEALVVDAAEGSLVEGRGVAVAIY